MSMIGPLPDTPQTYVDGTLGHLESALACAQRLGAHVWSLLARIDALEAEVVSRGHTVAEVERENERLREENLELRRLLVEVQETFAGVDPVGVDLRNRISEFMIVEPRETPDA